MKFHRRKKTGLWTPVRIPRLRLYQQIFIYFILVVFIPLAGASFIIYNINQKALQKEVGSFTEHTADAIYQDLRVEMDWQRRQLQTIGLTLKTLTLTNPKASAEASLMATIGSLYPHLTSLTTYDAEGQQRSTASFINGEVLNEETNPPSETITSTQSSGLKALPKVLPKKTQETLIQFLAQTNTDQKDNGDQALAPQVKRPTVFEVVYQPATPTHPERYFLQGTLLLDDENETLIIASKPNSIAQQPDGLKPPSLTAKNGIRYITAQWPFDYLKTMVQNRNKELFDGFYLINSQGQVIAGPSASFMGLGFGQPRQINPKDYAFFKALRPGVSKEFTSPLKTLPDIHQLADEATDRANGETLDTDDENEVAPKLQKVFIKMGELDWGIIIESPYHVRQKYIKRARTQTLLLILACFALVIGFTITYVLGIHRNFRQLIKGIKAMAEGRYSRRIRLISRWYTPYEIFFLTSEFNRMGRRIAESWNESQSLTQELTTANAQLAKVDELKSNLIDTVSHELRTPLTSIKGYTSRLIRYDATLDAEARIKNLKVIKTQADRLSRLVDDLLAIPELEAERIRIFPDRVNLVDLIDRSVHLIQQKQDRVIQIQLPEAFHRGELSLDVLADPDRLEQVILNLLDNALKYSADETTPLQVSVGLTEPNTKNAEYSGKCSMVQLTLKNPSDPIPQEQLATLFDKFQRLDESTTRTTRGSGLGLFITKGLIEAMDGTIELAYENGWFSVILALPQYEANPQPKLPLTSLVTN